MIDKNFIKPQVAISAVTILAFSLVLIPKIGSAQASAAAGATQQTPAASQDNASGASEAPVTPREKDELHARILMATKKYSEAAKAYGQLSVEDPRNASYQNFAGIALMQDGDLNGARKAFERATKVNKKFADAYNNLGAIYYAQKQYHKAIRQYQKSVAIQPQTAGFYSNLGYAYFAQKKYPEAFGSFKKAMALDPNTFQQNDRNGSLLQYRAVTDRGLFDFMLAKSYAQAGDAAHCATYLRKAIDDGYKDVGSARKDPDFAKILKDPEVQAVLDQVAEPPTKAAAVPPGA